MALPAAGPSVQQELPRIPADNRSPDRGFPRMSNGCQILCHLRTWAWFVRWSRMPALEMSDMHFVYEA